MNKMLIPYSTQSVRPEDIRAVVKVLRSDRLTQGPQIERFEAAFARYVGAPYAVAVSSGTAGLHLAALAAGFGPGDEVITSPMSFVATANSILYAGARASFVDIDPRSLGLDAQKIRKKISKKTKGIVNVHFAGQPSRLGPGRRFSNRKDFVMIEDACHALGAEYKRGTKWARIGSCLDAEMAVFSFHPVKHITTGEGGMITTRRKDLWEKMRLLRSHGIERDPERFVNGNGQGKPWYYEMTALGFNYRITDIQCALGFSQLKRIDAIVRKRREIAFFYTNKLKNFECVQVPQEAEGARSSWHLYVLRFDFKALRSSRESVMKRLKDNGIATQVHYIPVTDQPYYRKQNGGRKGGFPVAEAYYEQALSIPLYPAMKPADIRKVIREIKKVCARPCP